MLKFKKFFSILLLVIFILIPVWSFASSSSVYTAKYHGYNPDNVGTLTYLKWESSVKVNDKICPLNDQIGVDNLDCIILLTGKNNKDNLIYSGKYEGNLVEGENIIKVDVYKEKDLECFAPGKDHYIWTFKIKIKLNPTPSEEPSPSPTETIIQSEEPSPTPTETPLETISPNESTEIPTNTISPTIESTETPTENLSPIISSGNYELPKTGESSPIGYYIIGGLLLIVGTGFIYFKLR